MIQFHVDSPHSRHGNSREKISLFLPCEPLRTKLPAVKINIPGAADFHSTVSVSSIAVPDPCSSMSHFTVVDEETLSPVSPVRSALHENDEFEFDTFLSDVAEWL